MKKRTNGKKGEINCQQLVCGIWDAKLLRTNDDGRYDFKVELPDGDIKTFEVKTNPAAEKYGGFSVEVAHRRNSYLTSYINRPYEMYEGIKVVLTGLLESEADFYIFHDDKKQYYFISKKRLMEWFEDIWSNHHHRVVWGGRDSATLQIQIRISELLKLGKHIDMRGKRGRKPKKTNATFVGEAK